MLIAFSDGVVAGDYDSLRSNQSLAAFLGCLEGIVICPNLHVMTSNLLWSHLFDDDS